MLAPSGIPDRGRGKWLPISIDSAAGRSTTAAGVLGWVALLAVVVAAPRRSAASTRRSSGAGHRVPAGPGPARGEVPGRRRRLRARRVRGARGREAHRPGQPGRGDGVGREGRQGRRRSSQVIDPYTAKAISQGRADRLRRRDLPDAGRRDRRPARDELEAQRRARRGRRPAGRVRRRPRRPRRPRPAPRAIGIMVGFLVLAITLGSLVAAGLPLLTAIIGVGTRIGGRHRAHRRRSS